MKRLQRSVYNLGGIIVVLFLVLSFHPTSTPVFEEKKYVALTYDDGPSKLTTSALIDLLEEYEASATFFVNGNHANDNKALVKKIVETGNEIGNHTLDHVWLTKMSDEERFRQIQGNENLLEFLSGQEGDMLVRPPYGDINQTILDSFNRPFIMWSVDSRDWEVKNVAAIQSNVFTNILDGDIIIMHDGYSSTVEGTKEVLKKLEASGFQVVSVRELFRIKGKEIPLHEKVHHCR